MTVIKSKVERGFWRNAALSAIPDLLLAWAMMKYMDGGAETFFFTLLALQAAYLALWAKRSIWSWTLFVLTNRAFMSNHVEEVLASQRFPKPPDFLSGPDAYYQEIVDGKDENCEMRIKSSFELGTLAGISVAGQHQLAMQIRMATEDALQRYSKRAAATPKPLIHRPQGASLSLSRDELATIAWLADYGFRVVTASDETYRRSIEQVSHQQAAAYASAIDRFERECVPDLLAEDEDDKELRFESQQNRYHTIWSNYPNKE
ncbi:hypothetical protein IVB45_22640 [Bradyrhizobium sp. 4]|uniref:hypothetical protein n=1 Tax=unclassified Bradyrhizobium TaxID=2631580 RepID=UPI001FF83114|nr:MULTISPECIES: hypothetical protein [unclassified Bradyrhizobium]MCK1402701.1 hypothetical protein [Bradyrhizobium sp. 39]MCK1748296.1 hypothetical protein [Bradyrhizobium sp. 135]UPJ32774.1 hypothetical protein IVB45_22640 [Bradyrhizobium sp. 4]